MKTMQVKLTSVLFLFLFINPVLSTIIAQSNLFTNGQEADIILHPFAAGTNASWLNHPGSVMTDGVKFFVADTRNNRVLIWDHIPTTNFEPADVVVGQQNFETNMSGCNAASLNWPMGVYSDGARLYVTDTNNDRVLIWNQIPTTNGQPADIVLGQEDFISHGGHPDMLVACTPSTILWPWDVYADGTKLIIASTNQNRVMIWNSIPTSNNQPADLVLGQNDLYSSDANMQDSSSLASPRRIACDGTRLSIGCYSNHSIQIWNNFPTINNQPADLILQAGPAVSIKNGMLITTEQMITRIWKSFPTNNNQEPDLVYNSQNIELINPKTPGSGCLGVFFDGVRLYISDTNLSRVLIFNSLPHDVNVPADIVIGQPAFDYNIFHQKNGARNGAIVSTGKKLLVSTCDKRILIYQNIPDVDGDSSDNIISSVKFGDFQTSINNFWTEIGNSMWTDGIKLFALDRTKGIFIWERIPETDNVSPDKYIQLTNDASNLNNDFLGITVWENKLFVSDASNKKILVWNDYRYATSNPDFTIQLPIAPESICTDGKKLIVSGGVNSYSMYIWDTLPTHSDQQADRVLEDAFAPYGIQIFNNMFFVAAMSENRVQIYDNVPSQSHSSYIALGQDQYRDSYRASTRKLMYMPKNLWFDGEVLWVAEHKFQDRFLGFKANISQTPAVPPSNLHVGNKFARQIDIEWDDNSDNERGFEIKYKKSTDLQYQEWGSLVPNYTKYSITGLEPNTSYDFKIVAFNSYGESESNLINDIKTLSTQNLPPFTPSNPYPVCPIGEQIRDLNDYVRLQWNGGDPDPGDNVTYDVYLGSNPPQLFLKNLSTPFYYNGFQHLYAGEIYWKVVARDCSGTETVGPIWYFFHPGPWPISSAVTIEVSINGNGETNPPPGSYYFDKRRDEIIGNTPASALINAFSAKDNSFSYWSGDVPDELKYDNPLNLPIDHNRKITANFISTDVKDNHFPYSFNLYQNYPNPFNPVTIIKYSVPQTGNVKLIIFNILGQKVKILVDQEQTPGEYEIKLDATNLASGVYICRLESGSRMLIKKLLLLK